MTTSPPLLAALGTILLVAIAALSVSGGVATLVLAVVLAQACLACYWGPALAVPGVKGIAALALGVGAVAAGALALTERDEVLAPLAALLGMSVLVGFCLQLVRRDGRPEVVASLTAALSAAILTGLGSMLVAAARAPGGRGVVLSSLVGVGMASAVIAVASLPPRGERVPPGTAGFPVTAGTATAALVAGALAGGVLGAVAVDALTTGSGAALAAAAALFATIAARLPERVLAAGDRSARVAVGAALPVLAAGPVAYVLGRVLIG